MSKLTLSNFRDLGGLNTPYGTIRCGKIYRTSIFAPKTRADRQWIEAMRLDSVVDLRTFAEASEKPDKLPDGVQYIHSTIFGESDSNGIAPTGAAIRSFLKMSQEELDVVEQFVLRQYREMPFSAGYDALFAEMDNGHTFAFHCTAGKDRTGVGALLIELALGRTPEQCCEQYLLSNEYRRAFNERVFKLLRLMRVKDYTLAFAKRMLGVHQALFDTAMEAILAQYPTIDDFLHQVHGVTADRRRQWMAHYIDADRP